MLATFSLGTLALSGSLGVSIAQTPPAIPTPTCAWPYEGTPIGLGNIAWPDTMARYLLMPIHAEVKQMTVTGSYPEARYMSFALYDDFVPTKVDGGLFDAEIEPDPGSVNPFASPGTDDGRYSVTITRGGGTKQGNVLNLSAAEGWLAYRLYVPNMGEDSFGGVPFPSITITDTSGHTQALKPCQPINNIQDVVALFDTLFPPGFRPVGGAQPSGDHIWFAPPETPPVRLLPNPDNKYLAAQFQFAFQKGRLIVIRGKMPGFPDTFHGSPINVPARGFGTIEVRYWSMCQNDLAQPFPVVQCATDATTPLDEKGFYTIVVSDDLLRPDWVPDGVTWLPWGDEDVFPKAPFMRNMLPEPGFGQSVQDAIAKGCTFQLNLPQLPDPDDMAQAGQCAQGVMGEFYPEAVWCDQQTFASGSWQACFRAAGLPADMAPPAKRKSGKMGQK